MYDILIQNNASKKIWVLEQLENASDNNLYLQFDNVTLPSDAEDGEYNYAIIYNGREDVEYETNAVLLKTKVICGDGEYLLEDLKPMTGLMRVGKVTSQNTYKSDKEKDNNTIYYYKK